MKICKTCKSEKSLIDFGKSKRHKDGLLSSCKECTRKKRSDYFKKNPEAFSKKRNREKQWKLDNPERVKINDQKYRNKNKEAIDKRHRNYVKNNPDKIKKAKKHYEIRNPEVRAEIKTRRRAAERLCVPEWSEKEKIRVIYQKAKWLSELTGLTYHVDHIIPIQGKDVCGLHVWSNLQILEASINCSKQDKYDKCN